MIFDRLTEIKKYGEVDGDVDWLVQRIDELQTENERLVQARDKWIKISSVATRDLFRAREALEQIAQGCDAPDYVAQEALREIEGENVLREIRGNRKDG